MDIIMKIAPKLIHTAPKDKDIVAFCGGLHRWRTCSWKDDAWVTQDYEMPVHPTHWYTRDEWIINSSEPLFLDYVKSGAFA